MQNPKRDLFFYVVAYASQNFAWGMFWVIAIFALYGLGLPNNSLWLGILLASGVLTILTASIALPFLIGASAWKAYVGFGAAEMLLSPFYYVFAEGRSIVLFILLLVIAGSFDEVGKAVLPSILKKIKPTETDSSVSVSRTSQYVARFLGTLFGGAAYSAFGQDSFLVIPAVLALPVVCGTLFPKDVGVYEASSIKEGLRSVWNLFLKSTELAFTLLLSISFLVSGFLIVFIVNLLVSNLAVNSAVYGVFDALTWLASAGGASISTKIRWNPKRIITIFLGIEGISAAAMGIAPSVFLVFSTGILLNAASGLATTKIFQRLFQQFPESQIALASQLVYFLISIAQIVGNLGAGTAALAVSTQSGLLVTAFFYLALAAVALPLMRRTSSTRPNA